MEERITHYILKALKGLVFLLPIFFLPLTHDQYDFNKQYLLWAAVPILAILYIVGASKTKKIIIRRSLLDVPVILFIGTLCLSSFLGSDLFSSIYGHFDNPSNSLFGWLTLALLYFVIINISQTDKGFSTFDLVKVFIYSYVIVILFGWLSVFGILSGEVLLVGSQYGQLAFFAAAVMPLLSGLILGNYLKDKKMFLLASALWLLSLQLLVFINQPYSWTVLLVSMAFQAILYFIAKEKEVWKRKNLMPLAFLAILALLGMYVSKSNMIPQDLAAGKIEIKSLDYSTTFKIVKSSIAANPVFGRGLGSFGYLFSLHRPAELNNTPIWNIRFNSSPSFIMELAATAGLLGLAGFLMLAVFLFYFFYRLAKQKSGNYQDERALIDSLAAFFGAIVLGLFFGRSSTALLFLFWFSLALIMSEVTRAFHGAKKPLEINMSFDMDSSGSKPVKRAASSPITKTIFLSVLFLLWLAAFAVSTKYWLADFYFTQGQDNAENLAKAASLNPNREIYKIRLSKHYFDQAKSEMEKAESERDFAGMKSNTEMAKQMAEDAKDTNLNSVAGIENMGIILRDMSQFVTNSETLAIIYFKQAMELEPTNPVLPAEIGKLYLRLESYEEAAQNLEKALGLKQDYHEAEFYLAKAYSRTGKEKQALTYLEKLSGLYKDPEIFFEMGRIFFNLKDYEQAIVYFNKVLSIDPAHANSLYSLGLIHENKNDKKKALEYFAQVLEYNPQNQELLEHISALKKH